MLFSEWFKVFFDVYVSSLTYGCQEEYSIIYDKHYKILYDIDMNDIKPLHIQKCLNSAEGYSSSRRRKVYYLLNHCFDEAIINDICESNPVKKIRAPKKLYKNNIEVYDECSINQFFADSLINDTAFIICCDILSGLRRGELCALERSQIDLDNDVILVNQTCVRSKGGYVLFKRTKSGDDRMVPINETLHELLSIKLDKLPASHRFIFSRSGSKPLNPRTYQGMYKSYILSSGLPYLSIHKLRHTFASYLARSGCDVETLRIILGHSSIQTTNIYMHSNLALAKKAVSGLEYNKKSP